MINQNDITTIRVGELPPNPPTLESKIPHELGTDLKYFTIQQLITFLQPYVGVFQYETKRLAVTQAYIDENFDETGLGRNICIGWAIRNGNNGTDNIDGRVGVAYGASNNVIGQTGGSKNAVLVHHNHAMGDQSGSSGSGTTNIRYLGREMESNSLGIPYTDFSGESGVGKNMQPYIIDLYIMKL